MVTARGADHARLWLNSAPWPKSSGWPWMSLTTAPASCAMRARGAVRFLDIATLRGQAQVGVGLAARDDGVLALAVQAGRRAAGTEVSYQARGVVEAGMTGFDGLADAQVCEVVGVARGDGLARCAGGICRNPVTARAPVRMEEAAARIG